MSVDRFPFGKHVSEEMQRAIALFPRLTALTLSARDSTFQETGLPTTLRHLELEGDVMIECYDDAPMLLGCLTSLRGSAPDSHSCRPFFEKHASRLVSLELVPESPTWRFALPALTRLTVTSTAEHEADELLALLSLCPRLRSLKLTNACLERSWKEHRTPCPLTTLTALTSLKVVAGDEDELGDNLVLQYLLPALAPSCTLSIGCTIPPSGLASCVTALRLVKPKHLDGCTRLKHLALHKGAKVREAALLEPHLPLLASLKSLTAIEPPLAPLWPRLTQLRMLVIDSFPDGCVVPRFPHLRQLTVLVPNTSSPRTELFRAQAAAMITASPAFVSLTVINGGSVSVLADLLRDAAKLGVPHLVCHTPRYKRDAASLRDAVRNYPVTLLINRL